VSTGGRAARITRSAALPVKADEPFGPCVAMTITSTTGSFATLNDNLTASLRKYISCMPAQSKLIVRIGSSSFEVHPNVTGRPLEQKRAGQATGSCAFPLPSGCFFLAAVAAIGHRHPMLVLADGETPIEVAHFFDYPAIFKLAHREHSRSRESLRANLRRFG
jgi:hypothetical protein